MTKNPGAQVMKQVPEVMNPDAEASGRTNSESSQTIDP